MLAECDDCGAIFKSLLLEEVTGSFTSKNNIESCALCGGKARTLNGSFEVFSNSIRIISASPHTTLMIQAFCELLREAGLGEITVDEMKARAKELSPDLGEAAEQIAQGSKSPLYMLILLFALSHCDFKVEASLDLNQLYNKTVDFIFAVSDNSQASDQQEEATDPNPARSSPGEESDKISHKNLPLRPKPRPSGGL